MGKKSRTFVIKAFNVNSLWNFGTQTIRQVHGTPLPPTILTSGQGLISYNMNLRISKHPVAKNEMTRKAPHEA